MFLKKIELKNYRKFSEKALEFNKNIVVLLGQNAAGKTTILEAIYALNRTKTPKNNNLDEVVKTNEDFLTVKGTFLTKNETKNMLFSYFKGQKKVKINEKLIKKISEYSKEFFVIYFQPFDSLKYMISSQNRRNLIDSYISQVYDEYLNCLISYKRVLKEKNALLKMDNFSHSANNFVLLKMMNDKMSDLSEKIMHTRKEAIVELNTEIKKIHNKFSITENAEINYLNNLSNPKVDLEKAIYNEVNFKSAIIGIHKDDYEFIINEKKVASYCSQGQQKSFLLSLKIAMLNLVKEKKGDSPILILDDAFGDLDSERQNAIFNIVDKECQMFISTTSLKQIKNDVVEKAQIIEITKGEGNYE